MSMERYPRLLKDASPEFPIHFLNIYSNALSVADAYVSIRPWNNKSLPRMVRNERMALR